MLSILPLEGLSNFKKEGLQLKVKKNAKYEDILRLFTTVPFHPLRPLSIFHAEACYIQDYESLFINFLSYNAWGQIDKIDIPYHSYGDKILKYELEDKTIKFPNTHFLFQFCFAELEKRSLNPFTYTSATSPTLWPKSQEESKKE